MREFKINLNDSGQRLDKFISKAVPGLPKSLLYKMIRTKKIKVNRKRAEVNQMLSEGDVVIMFISEDFFSEGVSSSELSRVKPNLFVIYEDENIILADKKEGVLVHSGELGGDGTDSVNERNTLIFHIQAYLYQKGEYDPDTENSFAPSLCNRIDRNTGGIVIAAKNAQALREMNERIKNGEVSKFYLCAVHGKPEKNTDTLIGYLDKDSDENTVKVYKDEKSAPRSAKKVITKYTVKDYNSKRDLSLLEVELITGRTHQIRAHLDSIGHPLLGDGKYGINKADRELGYSHQALYSYKVRFDFNTQKEGTLSYLSGKTFTADKSGIRFLKEFKEI